ncbi:hypothetical protein [Pseudofrankia saprophytica]|uniref:hypothetical protein n=1 Tax=Pseudofrankia saprophytica TaxID=298655 RepID=UPI0002D591F2|nr:hypothetical protein [Pseudofrankia saprophytica]OHV35605.1 hypothetical protein BCD49_21645 [Pseudofrankia sp. EUN1h]
MAWPVQVLVVWPARVVAFAVFLPLRMLYELVALVLRWVVRATWEWLLYPALRLLFGTLRIFFKALWVVLSALWDWVLRPAGRALAWLWTRVGRPLLRLVWLGLSWLTAKVASALRVFFRVLLEVSLWAIEAVVRRLIRPVRWLVRVVLAPAARAAAWVLIHAGRAIRVGLYALGRLLAWSARHLVARPGRWFGRAVLAPGWRVTVAALAWAARATTVVLRLLVAVPLIWCWRTVVVPVGRASGKALRILIAVPVAWGWRTLVVPTARAVRVASRVLVVRPSRWVRHAVWQPIRETTSSVARALTGRPARPRRAKP